MAHTFVVLSVMTLSGTDAKHHGDVLQDYKVCNAHTSTVLEPCRCFHRVNKCGEVVVPCCACRIQNVWRKGGAACLHHVLVVRLNKSCFTLLLCLHACVPGASAMHLHAPSLACMHAKCAC